MNATDSSTQSNQGAGTLVRVLYDVRCWGSSFDFLVYLCAVDAMRKVIHPTSLGIELVIVTGRSLRNAGQDFRGVQFGTNYQNTTDLNTQRLHKMLLPLAELLPTVKSITVFDTKAGQKLGGIRFFAPAGYDPDHPDMSLMSSLYPHPRVLFMAAAMTDIRIIENNPVALNDAHAYVRRLTKTDDPIVFTVRNNQFSTDPSRNSTQQYLHIARRLSADHPVIIVPDTADVVTGMDANLPVAYEAAMDIRLRAALYEVAKANFCSNFGPVMLMSLNKKAVYYHADLETAVFSKAWFEKHWFEAQEMLKESGFDLNGQFQERLHQIQRGPNFYAPECGYQVSDYGALTFEKAEAFLASVNEVSRRP